MILTLIFIVLFVLSFQWLIFDLRFDWGTEPGSVTCTIIFGIAMITTVIMIPVCRAETIAEVKQFQSMALTVQQQRKTVNTELERATITKEVIDENKWLAKEQFWANSPWLDWFYDESILTLKPIE